MIKGVTEYNNYFREIFKGEKSIDRYGIPFATHNHKYFFDAGTGKVLQCTEEVYSLLINLFQNNGIIDADTLELDSAGLDRAVGDVKACIDSENIFKAGVWNGADSAHVNMLEEIIKQGATQLILEVTENCNLRCRYCIYGEEIHNFRSYGVKNMSFETAKKAIDYFLTIADFEKTIYLTFYGGEPLINYSLIREATEYFKAQIHEKTQHAIEGERADVGEPDVEDKQAGIGNKHTVIDVRYGLTSNLTLLSSEMAQYFADNDFFVTCSLDGDRDIHNHNRLFENGAGSFDRTMKGLEMLKEVYGEKAGKLIGVNVVVTEPYSEEKFQTLNDFFSRLDCVPDKTAIRISYAGKDIISDNTELSSNIDLITGQDGRRDYMGDWEFDRLINNHQVIFENFLEEALLDIHNRRMSNHPFKDYPINACCIPGTRRLYVTVDGNFLPCERIGISPYIGNVTDGIDIDSIRTYYVQDYIEKSQEKCGNCWAVQLCDVCYARCFNEAGLDMRRKRALCEASRRGIYNALIRYHILLEEHPEVMEKLFGEENDTQK
jgi:uncharacterized protein